MKLYAYFFLKADGTVLTIYTGNPGWDLNEHLAYGWIPLREVVISSDAVLLVLQQP